MFFVYILKNNLNKIYIGQTNNLEDRLRRHNSGLMKATKSGKPWKIIYSEQFNTRAESMGREKSLKGGQGREWIIKNLIS